MDTEAYECIIKHPAKVLISGSSGSGKTELIKHMILNQELVFENRPVKIYVFHLHDQTSYREMKEKSEIPMVFVKGPPSEDFKPERHSLIIFDDLMCEDSCEIQSWFIRKGHHYSCDIFYVVQNLFLQNKTQRNISLNANYLIVFRNLRDVSQLEVSIVCKRAVDEF